MSAGFSNAYAKDIKVVAKEKISHARLFPPIDMVTNPRKIYKDDAQQKTIRSVNEKRTSNTSEWQGKVHTDKISVLKQLEFGDSTVELVKSVWPNTRRVGLHATVTGADNPHKQEDWNQPTIGGKLLHVDGLDNENTVDTIVTKISEAWGILKPSIILRAQGVRKKLERNTLLSKLPGEHQYFCSLEPPPVAKNRAVASKKKRNEKWHQGGAFTGSQYVTKQFATGLRYVALRTPPILPKEKRKRKKKMSKPTNNTSKDLERTSTTSSEASEAHVAGQRHENSWTPQDCADAAREGDLEGLQQARGDGAKWDLKATAAAAQAGNLEILEFLRANGCPWNEDTAAAAAAGGQLEMLKYCRQGGCPWDKRVCDSAAGGGHIHVLEWAETNRGVFTEDTCAKAAENGQLEALKWLRERNCPWNKRTLLGASKGGHMDVLEWAVVHHCPR